MTGGTGDLVPEITPGERAQSIWAKIAVVFREHPTLILTVMYLYATGFGLLYSVNLYSHFGIRILDYADTGDFLLAAFKNYAAALSFTNLLLTALIGGPIMLKLVPWMLSWLMRSRRDGSKFDEWYMFWSTLFGPILLLGIAVIWTVLYIHVATLSEAKSIKQGENPTVVVQYRSFSGSTDPVTQPGLEFIGATQRVAFFYEVDRKHTLVVPQAQIVSIKVPEQD